MRRFARLGLLAALGCSTPGPQPLRPASTAAEAWRAAVDEGRLELAQKLVSERLARDPSQLGNALELAGMLHDRARLLALAEGPALASARDEPRARAALAEGLYWVAAPQALGALEAVCERGPEGPRARACARAAQVREMLVERRVVEGGDADVELLPGLPLPVVMASVNGLAPEPFLVDSGAGATMLNRAFCDRARVDYPADRFQLVPRGPDEGQLKLTPFALDRLEIGGLRIRHLAANVVDLPAAFKVGGILAPQDLFAGLLAELDLRANRLRVARSGTLADWRRQVREPTLETKLLWSQGGIYVRAEVERLSGWFLFDTGASMNLMAVASAEQIGRRLHHKKPLQAFWGAAVHEADEGFSALASIGGSPAVPATFGIAERASAERFTRRGSIGLPWMRGRRLAFGPDGRAMAFTELAADEGKPLLRR